MNLCEPVLSCSIKRILLGYDSDPLVITEEDLGKIRLRLEGKPGNAIYEHLYDSLKILCKAKSIDEKQMGHFKKEIKSMAVRLKASL